MPHSSWDYRFIISIKLCNNHVETFKNPNEHQLFADQRLVAAQSSLAGSDLALGDHLDLIKPNQTF